MKQSITIAMAFVGLLIGAGFATGKEMMQYFLSFGSIGFAGVAITGVFVIIFGSVVLQVGSYFLADEHSHVFKNMAHPRISLILDISVSATLALMGMMMLAGAGSSFEQSFGLPAWTGSLFMAIIVYLACLLDTDKVSRLIGAVTPLMIIAVLIVFAWTLLNFPTEFDSEHANALGLTEPSPVSPWWWAAINCAGMTLMCAIGMSLVIGGSHTSMRNVGIGGLIGGTILMIMMALETFIIYIRMDDAVGMDIPMTAVVDEIHPAAGTILAVIILIMIFNTALGDFYAFSRRVEVNVPLPHKITLAIILACGFGLSLFGFGTLIQIVFPILGYVGTIIGLMFVAWRIRWSKHVQGEAERRERIRNLTRIHLHPDLAIDHSMELQHEMKQSTADDEKLLATVVEEEKSNLDALDPASDPEGSLLEDQPTRDN